MTCVLQDGVKISCRAAGLPDGDDAALFIHGLNANMAFWHLLLLRQLGLRRRLITYDQRGHGYSDLAPRGYTSAELAADALAVLDSFEIERADIVAHSFGATVALQLARLHPERVRSIVVLDGHVRAIQRDLRLRDWSYFERWQSHFAEAGIVLDPDLELNFELPLRINGKAWDEARDALAADGFFVPSRGKRAREKYRKLLTETAAPREFRDPAGLTIETIAAISRPTMAIYGEISPYLPTRDGLLRTIPDCRSETIEGVGHNFPFLRPEKTAEVIEHFWLNRGSGRAAS